MQIYFAELIIVVVMPLFVDNFFAKLMLVQMRTFSYHRFAIQTRVLEQIILKEKKESVLALLETSLFDVANFF